MQPPYRLPQPQHILTVRWPAGRAVHFASMTDCWSAFKAGNLPVAERGVRMHLRPNDGSPGWAELHASASRAPVYAAD
jgi:hypothetical protein